jgi:hypothetical protein
MENVVSSALTIASEWKDAVYYEIEQAILGLEIMPSMRAMMTAGPALDRDNTAGYNCSYLPVDDPKSFDEAMYILLCGTGVGFSVERQYITKLPEVPRTVRKVGRKLSVKCWHSYGLVRFLSGMFLVYVLQVQDLKHLAAEHQAQRL